MKRLWILASVLLVGCQSIEDSPDPLMAVTPGGDSGVSFEVLSSIAGQCDGRIAQLYGSRASVPLGQKRSFSLALGNGSRACSKLQESVKLIREAVHYQKSYEKEIAYAESLVGSFSGLEPAGSEGFPQNFPEAGYTQPLYSNTLSSESLTP